MQLHSVDKTLYQQRFKVIAAGLALALAILGLGFSTLLIAAFGQAGSNTLLNALGVASALGVLLLTLQRLRLKPYFHEVSYVWGLKQELNLITRKMRQIKEAAQQGNEAAMCALAFSYAGSRQLWSLDDNTLVMEDLAMWEQELEALQTRYDACVKASDYDRSSLVQF